MEGLASCKEDDPVRRLWSANGLDHLASDLGCLDWPGHCKKRTVRSSLQFYFYKSCCYFARLFHLRFSEKGFSQVIRSAGHFKGVLFEPLNPQLPLSSLIVNFDGQRLSLFLSSSPISQRRNSFLLWETQFSEISTSKLNSPSLCLQSPRLESLWSEAGSKAAIYLWTREPRFIQNSIRTSFT